MARNTPFEGYQGPRLPKEVQRQRLNRVIQQELTIPQIARERGGEQKHRLPHPSPGGEKIAALSAVLSPLGRKIPRPAGRGICAYLNSEGVMCQISSAY